MNLIEIIKKLDIKTVYDIGANQGHWSINAKSFLPEAKFYLFEASNYYKERLQNTGLDFFIELLSDEVGKEVDFYDSTASGESYYKENTIWNINFIPKKILTNTIDNFVLTNNIPLPEFIKLDTQGSELDILKGASDTMKNVKVILTEMPIIEYNEGAPDIQEYLNYFDKAGFYPMNLEQAHHLDNVLVQIDIVFLRKELKIELFGKNNMLLL
jgi:FkbM family methyltransferase